MHKLTQTIVDSYDGRDGEILWDQGKGAVTGLGLRVREGGSRKWVFQYRLAGISHRITIGDAKARRLEAARAKARAMRVAVDDGRDPGAEKADRIEAAKLTLQAVVGDYLEAKQGGMRPRSFAETKRHLEVNWAPLHKLPIANIARATVAGRLRELAKGHGPITADAARSSLSALFGWAIGEGFCEQNPVTGTNKASENIPRDRTLSDDELVAIWHAAPDNHYGAIVKLLILTGCRRDEIGSMRWSEIDLQQRTLTLPAERTKNKSKHVVPLSDLAVSIIGGVGERDGRDLVFGVGRGGYAGWSASKAELDKAVKIKEPFTLHDLRRTFRSGLGKLAVAPHIAEAAINHLPAKLIRTYDVNRYENEKRQALDMWCAHLGALLEGKSGSNVRKLRA